MPVICFKNLILRYVSGVELIVYFDTYVIHRIQGRNKKRKETKLISMKQKRERKHNFIEVENKIIYEELVVNK